MQIGAFEKENNVVVVVFVVTNLKFMILFVFLRPAERHLFLHVDLVKSI